MKRKTQSMQQGPRYYFGVSTGFFMVQKQEGDRRISATVFVYEQQLIDSSSSSACIISSSSKSV